MPAVQEIEFQGNPVGAVPVVLFGKGVIKQKELVTGNGLMSSSTVNFSRMQMLIIRAL